MILIRAIVVISLTCGLLYCAPGLADDSGNSADSTANNAADNSASNAADNSAGTSPDNSAANVPIITRDNGSTTGGGGAATSNPAMDSQRERLTTYYIDEYGKLLRSQDWIARAMGILSIAKIDDPRISQLMMDKARQDANPLVRVFAWEALHARQDMLDKTLHHQWERVGLELGGKGYLRSELSLGFLGLLAKEGPTVANRKIFSTLFQNTNSLNPDDIHTILAMGDLLKQWQSPDLIQGLIDSMKRLDDAYRAELILHQVNPDIPMAFTLRDKGSALMWSETQLKWSSWAKATAFTELTAGAGPEYKGLSKIIARGERVDPTNLKWRREMEIRPFRLAQLDVGFAVDATGSMGQIVSWVQSDVIKMMRAFELLSYEPRIGVTFYRDRGDEFVTKTYPLTDNAKGLTLAMKDITAKGGGDIPESIYEGLSALLNQKWSGGGKKTRRVIMVIGDAPPHEETLKNIDKLVDDYAKKGFVFYAAKVRTSYGSNLIQPSYDPQLTTFDNIAKKGGGRSVWVDFSQHSQGVVTAYDTATARQGTSPEQQIFREVLTAAMEQDYHDRLDPFLTVLMHYVGEPVKEVRVPFGAKPTGGPGPATPLPPAKPPEDPQKQ